jgi:glycosidase
VRRFGPWLGLALAAAACSSSASDPPWPVRQCSVVVWHKPASQASHVEVVTSWEGWARPGHLLPADRGDGWRAMALEPPPGEQKYAVVEDGVWLPDAHVPTTAFHDGHEVTFLDAPDCGVAALRVHAALGSADGHADVKLTFLAARGGAALAPASAHARTRDGKDVAATFTGDPNLGTLAMHLDGLAPGKHVLVVSAKDTAGRDGEPARATVWIEPRPFDWHDAVVYQIMVDRYRDAKGPVTPPDPASAFAGGTLDGVRADIESGKLSDLGFNTLWLTPVYQGPAGAYPGDDGHTYTDYHGYWPTDSRAVDPRFGGDAALDALVASAHARGIRILFDVVPHHLHEEHPYVKAHPDWFVAQGQTCICGAVGCDWATHIRDCRFAPYLPTLDWTVDDVARTTTEDVVYWLDRFDGDGLRFDAVPMMPRAAMRRIAARVRTELDHPGMRSYLLGENFTGAASFGQLKYQLGPYGLDGEFHFPMMWAIRGSIAQGASPLSDIDRAERDGEDAWKGANAIMGLIIGNHDVTRFASESAGNADGDGWTPAPQPTEASVYQKQRMALATIYTLPGAPVVYYGDELALAGRHDPDSRRVMPAESTLLPDQLATRDFVAKLGKLRACSTALRRGAYRPLVVEGETLAYAREDGAARVVVAMSRNGLAFDAPLVGVTEGAYVDVLSGESVAVSPAKTVMPMAAWQVRVLVPVGDACAGVK